jgi:hypothetical protein
MNASTPHCYDSTREFVRHVPELQARNYRLDNHGHTESVFAILLLGGASDGTRKVVKVRATKIRDARVNKDHGRPRTVYITIAGDKLAYVEGTKPR